MFLMTCSGRSYARKSRNNHLLRSQDRLLICTHVDPLSLFLRSTGEAVGGPGRGPGPEQRAESRPGAFQEMGTRSEFRPVGSSGDHAKTPAGRRSPSSGRSRADSHIEASGLYWVRPLRRPCRQTPRRR